MEEAKDPVRERSDYQRLYYQHTKPVNNTKTTTRQTRREFYSNRRHIMQQTKLHVKVNGAAPQVVHQGSEQRLL
jgi:hypothetical protein